MKNAEPALETISEFNQTPGDEEVTGFVSRAVFGYSIISYYELVQSGTISVRTRPRFWGSSQIPDFPSNHHPLPSFSSTSCYGVLSCPTSAGPHGATSEQDAINPSQKGPPTCSSDIGQQQYC